MEPRTSIGARKASPVSTFLAAWTVVLLIALPGSASEPAGAEKGPVEWKLSPGTQQYLEERKLKRLAQQEPAEAIRRMDVLRGTTVSSAADTAIAEVALKGGAKAQAGEAAGLFMRAAVEAYSVARESAGPAEATVLYQWAVEGLITALQRPDAPAPGQAALAITGPLARYELSWLNAAEYWTPATHAFIPASSYRNVKKSPDVRRPGIGVPVVAWRKEGIPEVSTEEGDSFPLYRYAYPLTVVLELDDAGGEAPRRARLRFVDPRLHDTHRVGGVERPLAIDIRAQIAALRQEIDLAFGKSGAVHAGKYLSLTGLYPLEPPRPDKIPVVLIHGMVSSIRTWADAFEAFSLDGELRLSYQFAVFTYPSSLPFPYSAKLLRRALTTAFGQLDSRAPLHQRMVLIGHSMGGLLTRLQVTDSTEVLWYSVFDESPEEISLSPGDRRFMTEMLIFESLPFIERVVFCSTPHRGSKLAANTLGKVGVSVVKLPDELREVGNSIMRDDPEVPTGDAAERQKFPDGVQSMQPDYDLLLALDTLPIDDRVTYHSIIGDRGKGDSPESSDGIVAYWSSHLEGAASERIVPSGHSSQKSPEGIEELVRILHLHLDER